jgi:hypothetical protein
MDFDTGACLVIVAAIIVGGWLMSKEIDLRKPLPPPQPPCPPEPPLSDAARAIIVLENQLSRLQDEYENNNDSDVLKEISKVNATLAAIANPQSGKICSCGGKKV